MIRHTREVFQGTPVYDFVAGTENAYATNSLNQYRGICSAEANQLSSLQLSYDDDGNATSVQTSTGTWNVEYNAENRPVRWTNAATGTVITMTFDSQGRRTEYKSVTNGTQNTWLRFLYDGYLCVQVLYSNEPYNVFKEFVWDPTEPVATRPLVFRYAPNSLNLFYAFDGNKNVSDVFYRMNSNGIGAHYDYAPFGGTTRTHRDSSASFDIVALNPFRFSSEYYDSELDLVYYNYRHYSPSLGRFLSRDPIEEQGGRNLYAFVKNKGIGGTDLLGQSGFPGFSPISGNNLQCRAYDMIYPNRGRCRPCSEGGIECRTNRPSGIPPSLNGCGSKDSEWVPDSFFGIVSFTEACNKHDVCYGTCGANKADCDKGLREDMASACDKKFGNSKFVLWQLYLLCLAQAQIYESALLLAGSAEIAFEEGQDIACAWEKIPCMFQPH